MALSIGVEITDTITTMSKKKQAPMHLYDKPECPFCWKVKLALHELRMNWVETLFETPERPAAFLALNPNGTVPVLVDGENIITDSAVIVEYLQDINTAPSLLPESPGARAQARALHLYSTAKIGPVLREVVFEKRSKPEPEWDWTRIEAGTAGWRNCLDVLEERLGDGEYFAECYSFAECALTPRFALAERYGVGVDDAHPRLQRWFERMQTRPNYAPCVPAAW